MNVFELQGVISVDTSAFVSAMNAASHAAEQLQHTINNGTSSINASLLIMDSLAHSISDVGDSAGISASVFNNLTSNLHAAQQATLQAQAQVESLSAAYQASANATGAASQETQQFAQQLANAQAHLQQCQQAEQDASNAMNQYAENAQHAQQNTTHLGNHAEESGNQAKKAAVNFDKFKDSVEKVAETAWKAVEAIAKVSATVATTAGVALTGLTKQSLDAAASYEQLKGGVETLFGTGGMELEAYAQSVGKAVDEVKDEFDGFMEAQETVLENANKAFATAGMSANEYMETVTSFSASLIQATGRGEQIDIDALKEKNDEAYAISKQNLSDRLDAEKEFWDEKISLAENADEKATLKKQKEAALKELKRANEQELKAIQAQNDKRVSEAEASNSKSVKSAESLQEAARLSDMAIRDMSDNANKMGTAMASIQNAYQGFAKQNYTMLDNLKLGYGGTKEEMERLLDDAERLSGVEYDISNLADVYNAIHVIQQEMGISGMSAEEVAEAIASGAMTEEEAYAKMGTTAKEAAHTIEGSVGSMKAAWENLITAFGVEEMPVDVYAENFVQSISTAASNVIPRIGTIVKSIGDTLPGVASSIFDNLRQSIEENDLGTSILDGIDALVGNAAEELEKVFNSLFDGDTLSGLLERATGTVNTITKALASIFKTAIKKLPQVVSGAADILGNISGSIWEAITDTLDVLSDGDALESILTTIGDFINSGIERLTDDLPRITSAVSRIIETVMQTIPEMLSGENAGQLIDSVINAVVTLATTVANNIEPVVSAIVRAIPNITDALLRNLDDIINAANTIVVSLIDALTKDDGVLDAAVDMITGIITGITDNIDDVLLAVQDLVTDVLEKLYEPQTRTKLAETFGEVLSAVIVGAAKILGSLTGFTVELGDAIGEVIANSLKDGRFLEDTANALAGLGKGILEGLGLDMTEWDAYWEDLGGSVFDFVDDIKDSWNVGIAACEEFGAYMADVVESVKAVFTDFWENSITKKVLGYADKLFGGKSDIPDVTASNSSTSTSSRQGVTINFTQNNTSPEALDEYEIWRQNNRAFDMFKLQMGG